MARIDTPEDGELVGGGMTIADDFNDPMELVDSKEQELKDAVVAAAKHWRDINPNLDRKANERAEEQLSLAVDKLHAYQKGTTHGPTD